MNKITKWCIITATTALVVVLGVHNLTPHQNRDLKESSQPTGRINGNTLYVKATIVSEQSMSDGLNISGSLIPNEEVSLSFEKSGKISDIFFTEGSYVHKGDILAKINDAPLQAQLKKLQAQLKLNEDRLYRQTTLLEKEAVSQQTVQEAEASLSTLKADIEQVNAELAQMELRAPFDGIIGLRQVSVGAYVSPTTGIATLTNTSKLKVEFSVPERYAGILKAGAPLTFTVEGIDREFKANVYAVNSIVDSETRTYAVRAIYDNNDGALVPGRYVSVSLVARTYDNAIAIPSQAIISEMGIDKVFLYRNGKAEPVEITKGLRTEAQVQVLSGLSLGDTVITSGTMQLRTGTSVEIKELD